VACISTVPVLVLTWLSMMVSLPFSSSFPPCE